MTSQGRVLAALRGEEVDQIPWVELQFNPGVAVEMAGGPNCVSSKLLETVNWLSDAAGHESARNQHVRESMVDAEVAQISGKDNVIYWGAMTPFVDGNIYALNPDQSDRGLSADGIVKTWSDVRDLRLAKLGSGFRANAEAFLETKGDRAAAAMIWLGIDPVLHSMGFEHFSVSLMTDPRLVETFMDKVTDWCAQAAATLCGLGFDFIWAGDDVAFNTAPFFSPAAYREHLLPYTRKVANEITLPWIYHSDGNLEPLLDDLLTQGMDAIHPLEPGSMDLDRLKARYGARVSLVGNVDINTLSLGSTHEVEMDVKRCITQLSGGGRYLISSSNAITAYCRPENVRAMADAVQRFGRKPHDETFVGAASVSDAAGNATSGDLS